MSMKGKVRAHLKTLKDGDTFNVMNIMGILKVKANAVSNEICGMVEFGALEAKASKSKAGRNISEYTVIANTLSAFYLKFPNGCGDAKIITGELTPGQIIPRVSTGNGRRSAWEIKIDVMIKKLEKQLDSLKSVRGISL